MTQKQLNQQELEEILELAQKAEQKAKEMCEVIMAHSAKYQRWSEEAKIKQYSVPSK
jgi:Ni,Fe-hydrogenase III large subunit